MFVENTTGPLQRDKSKQENINISHPLVERKSSANLRVSKTNTKGNEMVHNNWDTLESQIQVNMTDQNMNQRITNQSKSINSNTIRSQTITGKLINIILSGDKKVKLTNQSVSWPTPKEREDLQNVTNYSNFSIVPRSSGLNRKLKKRTLKKDKANANFRVKLIDKDEDFGRDCFEQLREFMGSKGRFKIY